MSNNRKKQKIFQKVLTGKEGSDILNEQLEKKSRRSQEICQGKSEKSQKRY